MWHTEKSFPRANIEIFVWQCHTWHAEKSFSWATHRLIICVMTHTLSPRRRYHMWHAEKSFSWATHRLLIRVMTHTLTSYMCHDTHTESTGGGDRTWIHYNSQLSTSFHGSPWKFQRSFHGSPQAEEIGLEIITAAQSQQVFTGVPVNFNGVFTGVPRISNKILRNKQESSLFHGNPVRSGDPDIQVKSPPWLACQKSRHIDSSYEWWHTLWVMSQEKSFSRAHGSHDTYAMSHVTREIILSSACFI